MIGLANAGTDAQNCIKQAAEFGITRGGQRLATLLMIIQDVLSLGQDVCQGLVLTDSFYWDLSPETRAWTRRYAATMQAPPNAFNAACYAAISHWLKAVQAVGSLDADPVAARMHATPVEDFYNKGIRIQPNGCVPHAMYVWEVKPRSQSTDKWDVFKPIANLPSPTAYPPPGLFGCPLVPA